MSKFLKGHKPLGRALKGHVTSDETKKRIGLANKGKKRDDQFRELVSMRFKNKPKSEKQKRKISLSHFGKTIGDKNGMSRADIRKKHMENTPRGDKHPNWKGGKSFEPYSVDWTETLKRSIRERDNYICQICSQYGNHVHHIDYNKKNCNPNNLITLCENCHGKTNFNREYWIKYFYEHIK